MRMRLFAVSILLVAGATAWVLASNEGRVDADERVAAMLPDSPVRALWEPSPATQSILFAGQATLGAALLWFGFRRAGRKG